MLKCIVYTRANGEVSTCTPSSTALRFMTNGGGRWDGHEQGFIDRQIEEQSKYGVGIYAARRFVMAMQKGGCTDAEGFEIMRDRYCSHLGSGCELWYASDLPDYWFREAWRRSHNGGPVDIDMTEARNVQYKRLSRAVRESGSSIILNNWKHRIRRAKDPRELKSIWPKGLPWAQSLSTA